MLEQTIEVYKIDENVGELVEPEHVIETGCRGLNAIETSDSLIYMGFTGSLTDPRCII